MGEIYSVYDGSQAWQCSCLKTIRKNRLVIGDDVDITLNEYSKDKYIITKVYPRKNVIPRPCVANIDKLLIIIAPEPKPDFLLVDKLIIYSNINNIEPIIVINKCDLVVDNYIEKIKNEYKFVKTYVISAKENIGIDAIRQELLGNLSAVCGQSAVGKSSFINAILPNLQLQTQGLSEKISRGKHTTRVNEIHIGDNLMIADTPGFSNLDLNIDYRDLASYYVEFEPFIDDCRYLDCSHIKEGKDCGVCQAVERGDISKDRYLRYVELHKRLKENWENKYD